MNMVDIVLPEDQLEGTAAKVSAWLVNLGDHVTKGDPIVELETDKVTMEISAPETGCIDQIFKSTGDDLAAGEVVGCIALGAGTKSPEPEVISVVPSAAQNNTSAIENKVEDNGDARHLIGPAVRRLVQQHSLDIDMISGSGRRGRVTREDVLAYLEKAPSTHQTNAPAPQTQSTMSSRLVEHSTMRKAIANHMVESLLHTSPHVTSVFEMDMSNIIEHRRWHKKEFAEEGVKLTFTAYFLAATVKAMQAVPEMNARYHDHALEIFDDINIGVGTALGDDGLVVPVVQQVQTKKLMDIASALQAQTEKARDGKLTPADMKNGTFTISNHGVSGSLFATPIIINQPQVAILGIGKLEKRVVVEERDGADVMSIKPMCYVSLSIDHRAVDAFQTNKFLSVFVDCINSWGN